MLLEVNNLCKSFGGIKAVQNVGLMVDSNQIVSIIGPNGAGKTTILNLISGIYRSDSGKITFNGEDIFKMEQYKISRLGIARTFQNVRLFKGLTVIENLLTSCDPTAKYNLFETLLGMPSRRRIDRANKEKCMKYLQMVGLENYRDEHPENLPYGLQRRVELARTLSCNPKLIMLDEPAAGLNPSEVVEFIDLISNFRDRFSFGILIIEHRMRVINKLSDYVYVLNFGELLAHGLPEHIRNNPDVIKAYIGEES